MLHITGHFKSKSCLPMKKTKEHEQKTASHSQDLAGSTFHGSELDAGIIKTWNVNWNSHNFSSLRSHLATTNKNRSSKEKYHRFLQFKHFSLINQDAKIDKIGYEPHNSEHQRSLAFWQTVKLLFSCAPPHTAKYNAILVPNKEIHGAWQRKTLGISVFTPLSENWMKGSTLGGVGADPPKTPPPLPQQPPPPPPPPPPFLFLSLSSSSSSL